MQRSLQLSRAKAQLSQEALAEAETTIDLLTEALTVAESRLRHYENQPRTRRTDPPRQRRQEIDIAMSLRDLCRHVESTCGTHGGAHGGAQPDMESFDGRRDSLDSHQQHTPMSLSERATAAEKLLSSVTRQRKVVRFIKRAVSFILHPFILSSFHPFILSSGLFCFLQFQETTAFYISVHRVTVPVLINTPYLIVIWCINYKFCFIPFLTNVFFCYCPFCCPAFSPFPCFITVITAHCTLHTPHCTLHTAHCTLHTAHCNTTHTPHTHDTGFGRCRSKSHQRHSCSTKSKERFGPSSGGCQTSRDGTAHYACIDKAAEKGSTYNPKLKT